MGCGRDCHLRIQKGVRLLFLQCLLGYQKGHGVVPGVWDLPFMLILGSNQIVPAFILHTESRSIWPAPAKSFRLCSSVFFQPHVPSGPSWLQQFLVLGC